MNGYLSVSEYALKNNKDVGNIRRLLIAGRIKGYKIGKQWVIQSDTPYPSDKRVVSGNFVNRRHKLLFSKNKFLVNNLKLMSKDLLSIFGNHLESIVVYGSYARGEQSEESDVDIAVFVDYSDVELRRMMNECVSKYELIVGKVLSVVDINTNIFDSWKETLPFYKNLQKEGIVLWMKK